MKKVLLSVAVAAAFGLGMTSCGGAMDTEKAAKEFCECSEKEGDEKQTCYDSWIETYKGGKATEEDGAKMGEAMAACAPMDALEVLMKAAE